MFNQTNSHLRKSAFSFLLMMCLASVAAAQLIIHPWPEESLLLDDSKYEIRVRERAPGSDNPGMWQDLQEFYSYQRSYPNHWKCGDDAGTDFMADRSLTFVAFSFRGSVEVEVTQKLADRKALGVELAPKAFGFAPHFFDGYTVRFYMDQPEYLSVHFQFGKGDKTINGDDNRAGGADIRHGCMLFTEIPEPDVTVYEVPLPDDPGVVVWDSATDLSVIRGAEIIYFPAGEHFIRAHKDRWERSSSWEKSEAGGNWVTTESEYRNAALYRGRLNLGRDNQRVYLAPGAIVHGGFHSAGKEGNWLYGRGIVTGRSHLMHEIVVPATGTIAETEPYQLVTRTKEAFCHFGHKARYDGILFLEAWHHTCPSGQDTRIERVKIIGWCSNNDGIRPGDGSQVDRIFIKTSDDYDYYRGPHTMRNAVVWPMVNGAVGQMGWNDLGTGYATYENLHVIHSEWHVKSITEKSNIGVICGGKANAGIQLQKNTLENCHIEHHTNFLVAVALEGSGTGYLKDFSLRNVTTEYPFQNPAGDKVMQELRGAGDTWCENWTFSNVFIDGVLLTWDNYRDYFNLELEGINGLNSDASARARNIAFNWSGTIHEIRYTVTGNGSIRPAGSESVIQVAGGMDQTVTLDPDDGHRIKSIAVDGENVFQYGDPELTDRRPSWVFPDISADHTLEVEFEAGEDYFDLERTATTSQGMTGEPVRIYPVPAGDQLVIQTGTEEEYRLTMFGIDGTTRLHRNFSGAENRLPLKQCESGIYLVEIQNSRGRHLHRIVVQ